MSPTRIRPDTFQDFALAVFEKLDVPQATARLATRSLLEASLVGVESHGIESLEMYVNHLLGGGLQADREPERIGGVGGAELWDMQGGFGLAGARKIMAHAIERARENGICLATVHDTNHIGACGIYGKIAADKGLIGVVSQQSFPCLSPWGGKEIRVGSSPLALVAPIEGMFPFYFDCQMASMTRSQVKAHRISGNPLPEGAAMDSEGNPTTDPEAAWFGQLAPIGQYKGVGLAMAFEVLSAILSGNRFSNDIPSIVNEPDKSAGSSFFMIAIDPAAVFPGENFPARMREYVAYIESSPAIDPENPPRYPGRREGENWRDRTENGIPVSEAGLQKFNAISQKLGIASLELSPAAAAEPALNP
jgi:LDH2 family malate/lactate/ureidoglycolate dehydrogenase